jgi:hypothetical protein
MSFSSFTSKNSTVVMLRSFSSSFPALRKAKLYMLVLICIHNIHSKVKNHSFFLATTKETTLKQKITELTPPHPEKKGLYSF